MKDKRLAARPAFLIPALLLALSAIADPGIRYFQGHENGKVTGFDKTDAAMFRASDLKSKYYTEPWFHEMQFPDEGIIVIVNFQRHNMGFSSGYLDAYLMISDKDNDAMIEQWSGKSGDVKIADTGFKIVAGPHLMKLEKDTYRVRFEGKDMKADVTYKILIPSFQQGDGKVVFKDGEFVRYNFPIPWAEVSGTLTYKGKTRKVKGNGSMNHDLQDLSPLKFPTRWRALWAYGEDMTVSMVNCSAADFKGEWAMRLMVAEKGKILFSSHDFTLKGEDFQPVPGGNVPMPMKFAIEAVHGDSWLKGGYKVVRVQEKKNALDEAPSFLRPLASLVISEMWSYRYWMDYEFEFHQDGQTRTVKGRGVANYVDSVDAKE